MAQAGAIGAYLHTNGLSRGQFGETLYEPVWASGGADRLVHDSHRDGDYLWLAEQEHLRLGAPPSGARVTLIESTSC